MVSDVTAKKNLSAEGDCHGEPIADIDLVEQSVSFSFDCRDEIFDKESFGGQGRETMQRM